MPLYILPDWDAYQRSLDADRAHAERIAALSLERCHHGVSLTGVCHLCAAEVGDEVPWFIHDCDDCVFLGHFNPGHRRTDLYYCPTEPTVVARRGLDGEYLSGLESRIPALIAAEVRYAQHVLGHLKRPDLTYDACTSSTCRSKHQGPDTTTPNTSTHQED